MFPSPLSPLPPDPPHTSDPLVLASRASPSLYVPSRIHPFTPRRPFLLVPTSPPPLVPPLPFISLQIPTSSLPPSPRDQSPLTPVPSDRLSHPLPSTRLLTPPLTAVEQLARTSRKPHHLHPAVRFSRPAAVPGDPARRRRGQPGPPCHRARRSPVAAPPPPPLPFSPLQSSLLFTPFTQPAPLTRRSLWTDSPPTTLAPSRSPHGPHLPPTPTQGPIPSLQEFLDAVERLREVNFPSRAQAAWLNTLPGAHLDTGPRHGPPPTSPSSPPPSS